MTENNEIWREKGTFAVINHRSEILLYDAVLFCPTVEEPWGNTIEKIRPGYFPFADPANGCVGARIDRNVVHYAAAVEGKHDMISVQVYTAAITFYNKEDRKDYVDLFIFPNNRVLPRGGVPLTLSKIIYKKEDEHIFDSVIVKREGGDIIGKKYVPVKKMHMKVLADSDTDAFESIETSTETITQTVSLYTLMSLYTLYYISLLAFLTEIGNPETYYACILVLLGSQWAYTVHTIYGYERDTFFQESEKN